MSVLRKIAIGVLLIFFIVLVSFFGRIPALRSTPINLIHRVIWQQTPRGLRNLDHAITGGRVTAVFGHFFHYLVYEKNPIVLIFFLTLLTGSSVIFLYASWSRLALLNQILVILLLPQPYVFTFLCARSTSSYITSSTHVHHMSTYPYDQVLFHPEKICRTCRLQKPPRSKHCSICRLCVSRADHHCVFVNNCLGAHNYRWFILLLISTALVLSYGGLLAFLLLRKSAVFSQPGAATSWKAAFTLWTLAIQRDLSIGAVGLLATLTSPLAWALLVFHVYLAWAGMTTNEQGKWADLRDDMADGLVWVREIPQSVHVGDDGSTWPAAPEMEVARMEKPSDAPSETNADGEAKWRRAQKLHDLNNLYDQGFVANVIDALDIRELF